MSCNTMIANDDLDDLLSGKYNLTPDNSFIADPNQAVSFVAALLGKKKEQSENQLITRFRCGVEALFQKFRDVTFPDELLLYRRFLSLCERLNVIQKVSRLGNKTIVGFGGKFSSGKSSFINSISGIKDILPEAQEATTSIPTYIVKGENECLTANTIFGDTLNLTREALEAMTHEFRRKYEINCAPFVDSIIVEVPTYSLDPRIALLDTPGYTKPDDDVNSRMVVSDKVRAYEQLRVTDYLIWLIDMDNDPLTQNDIDFIDSLDIKSKILIVFNKADLRSERERKQILAKANEDIKLMCTPVFGIAAYSSKSHEEYTGHIIRDFFTEVAESRIHNNDLLQQFRDNANQMRESLTVTCDKSKKTATDFLRFIMKAQNPEMLCSMARLWKDENMEHEKMKVLVSDYDADILKLEQMLKELLGD